MLIGRAAKAAGKGWILLIDEVQYLSEQDLSALIVSIHRMSQEGLPVLLVGAGLPQGVACTTIHKVCGSGLKAAMFAHDLLKAGVV